MTKKTDLWMPLLVDKYLGDTTDLTTEQHGAYLLLLMSMWKKGGSLPNVDETLMTITHLTPARWRANKAVLLSFFRLDEDDRLRQKRLSQELKRAQKSTEAKSEAGAKGAAKRWQTDSKPDGTAIGKPDSKPPDKPDGEAGDEPMTNGVAHEMANESQTPWRNDASLHKHSSLRSERAPGTAADLEREARAQARAGDDDDPNAKRSVTPAAAVCIALKRHGIGSVNPGNPKLQALLEAGATEAEFVGAADKAKDKRDPFSYVLSVVEGQRRDAKEVANGVHHGPLPGSEPTPPLPWYESPEGIRAKGAELGMPWSDDGWINGQHMSFPSYAAAVRRRAMQKAAAEHTA